MTEFPHHKTGLVAGVLGSLRSHLHLWLFATNIALATAAGITSERLDWTFAFHLPENSGHPAEFNTIFDLRGGSDVMHSPHIAIGGDAARILWFQGSAEAVNDVEIWAADLAIESGRFGDPFEMFDARAVTGAMEPAQPVLILGNTIQARAGNLNRYVATVVSAGGWAAASLARLEYRDGVPVRARKLPLSPFINRSNLVRNGAVAFGDGDLAIPAYHELAAGFGLLVRMGMDGRVRSTARMGFGKSGIQPEIVVTGPKAAVAFLRPFDRSRRLFRSETLDGGETWTHPMPVAGFGNPDAPVAALLLSDGRILMAANTDASNDHSLSLLVSSDNGLSWREVVELEKPAGKGRNAVRYPDMERLASGKILLTYSSHSKHGIRAHVFTEAWINTRG